MSLITQTENLTKIYGSGETAVTALDHVNLKVNPGEFVAMRWKRCGTNKHRTMK